MKVRIKRVYEKPLKDDGLRILVDRIWPRAVSKEEARIDIWLKEIAPSDELRKWFSHDPLKWKEFKKRYIQELKKNKEQVSLLKTLLEKGTVTLIYSAKDEEHNQSVVLQEFFSR